MICHPVRSSQVAISIDGNNDCGIWSLESGLREYAFWASSNSAPLTQERNQNMKSENTIVEFQFEAPKVKFSKIKFSSEIANFTLKLEIVFCQKLKFSSKIEIFIKKTFGQKYKLWVRNLNFD